MITKVLFLATLSAVAHASHQEHQEHHHHHPQPYKFGYEIKDHHGSQHRHEHGDGQGHVQGNYGFTDHRGIHREVHYVADKSGFRATVKTNEPGTANQDPADVKLHSDAHYTHHQEPHKQGHHHQEHHHQHGHAQVYHHQANHHGHYQG
ncbi:cuticle protein 16.8-like [Argiope bruennichi]|uniref:Cuticle protein 16.8 like protein n=1 Tax=Argiope bruennichi TaxID=94029 RepID=A0A8T0EHG2_ARGBR|nr:cuticle protein 16.8-like [Argiope bruennichi]KAF8773302.1 Cuticle protein 16.8 like protein [Argiope bruennichi]